MSDAVAGGPDDADRAADDEARAASDGVPRWAVLALGTGLFGLGLTVGGYGAVVPLLVAAGATEGAAGAGTSLFLLGQAVAVLPADRLSRRRRPRQVAAAGLALAAVGAALTAWITLPAALVSRALVGLGQGAAFVAAMKHVGRRTSGADTAAAQGLLGAGFTLGFAVGLAATPTAVDAVGPVPPAAISAVVIAASAVAASLVADTGSDTLSPLSAYVTALRESTAAALSLANAVTFGFLIVAGTWYAELLAGSPVPAFPVLVGFALATVVGRAVGGVLAARLGDRAVVGWSLLAQALVLVGTAAAIVVGAPLAVAAGVILTGLGFGVPFGPLFALAFTEISPDAGITLTGMMVVGNVAAVVYPWLVGRLLAETGSFAIGVGSMAATVAVVAVLWVATIGLAVTR